MARTRHQGRTSFNRNQFNRFLAAIEPSGDYFDRLDGCGSLSHGAYGWTRYCKLPPCPVCRSKFHSREWKRVRDLFAGANSTASMVSMVAGACADLDEAADLLRKVRERNRNIVDARRRRSAAWDTVQMTAWLEMDAFDPDLLPLLQPQRAALLASLGAGRAESVIWVPTLHGLIDHPRVGRDEITGAFRRAYPLPNQFDLQPLRPTLTFEQNVENVTAYALKHRCTYKVAGAEQAWPQDWMISYYGWLNQWSQSFRKVRFEIRSKRKRSILIPESRRVYFAEPMPVML